MQLLSKTGRQYSIGDKNFRETMGLLKEPWVLQACQAGAVGAKHASLVVLATLAQDDSDESRDALLAVLKQATDEKDEWNLRHQLAKVLRYSSKSAFMISFDASVKAALSKKQSIRNKSGWGQKLELHVESLKFSLHLNGKTKEKSVFVWLSIDDSHSSAYAQTLIENGINSDDVSQWPQWIANLVKRHDIVFDWKKAQITSNLLGKYRTQFVNWMQGAEKFPYVETAPKKSRT
jgi:hypothetical protein